MFDMGAKTIVEKILPVIDNFERGLAAVPDDKKDDPFITGMDKVYKQMLTELDAAGVKPIECVGQEFDPDFHNAVMQVENDELESGTVAQELQKGYMYKDSSGTPQHGIGSTVMMCTSIRHDSESDLYECRQHLRDSCENNGWLQIY